MPHTTRRGILATAAFILSLTTAPIALAQDLLPVRFTLDWKYQGVHAWFLAAKERGYFEEEGLDVTIDQGEGSAATVTRIMSGAYDAGFGDINAIIQAAADRPDEAPVMVYQIYNAPPFAALTRADGTIETLADLAGKTVGGPAGSAATKLMPALLAANDVDPTSVEVINMQPNLQEQMLIQGDVDASMVFNVTSYMNLVAQGRDPETEFVWFNYGDYGLDLYSNGVMVSQAMIAENPEAVRGLVAAINRAIIDVVADPAAGVAVVSGIEPLIDAGAEEQRIAFALERLMFPAMSADTPFGDIDTDRLSRSIATIAEVYEIAAPPAAETVFNDAFLPAIDERPTVLGQ